MPVGSDVLNVKKTLELLREKPADTAAATDSILEGIYSYLMRIPANPDGALHWFCNKAEATTIDAATFLIRLMAYNSPQVVEWKKRLHHCLSSCAFCARGLEIAKVTSQTTYLAAFSQDILRAFFVEFDKWEVNEVVRDLHTLTGAGQGSSNNAPTATLYRMISNWAIFCNSEVLSYLKTHTLAKYTEEWPDHPLPTGLLILLISDHSNLRLWATNYASRSRIIDLSLFSASYLKAMELVIFAIDTSHDPLADESRKFSLTAENEQVIKSLPFAKGADLWSGVYTLLRLVPPEWFKSNSTLPLEFKRKVINHLHDKEPYFNDVFKCFSLLLKRLSKDMWSGEGPEYPAGVFEAIRGNPFYANHLSSLDSSSSHLAWIQEYLSTIRDYGYYGTVLERSINCLFEDCQQERFQKCQYALLKILMQILHQELQKSFVDKNPAHSELVSRILKTHMATVASIGYTADGDETAKTATASAQAFIEVYLKNDVRSLENAIVTLCQILSQKKRQIKCDELPVFSLHSSIWQTYTSSIRSSNAIASVVCIVSEVAHIDSIKESIFSKQWNFPVGDEALKNTNQAIRIIQNGFSDSISRFADYNTSSQAAIDIIQRPGVGKAVTLLLLSPIEDYQSAGKTLAGLAFDVDGRMECFRSLLANLPNEALDGIFAFLTKFHTYASKMPEASSLSAALVRCFADILDVLCASPDGLLHNSRFLRPNDPTGPAYRMLKFWNLLTKSLCLIYARASMWAQHIDTPDMVLWMRDALILAKDALTQWRVIEKAANASVEASLKSTKRGETSPVGRQMIGALQDFLPELIRWLRLTDEELLHQSFSLLQSVFSLMKETHVHPLDSTLEKLSKYVDSTRNMPKEVREQKTRLDRGRLLQLSELLSHFKPDKKDDDEEVVVISHTKPTQRPVAEKPAVKNEAVTRPYIQGKSSTSKPANRPTQAKIPFPTTRVSGSKTFSEKDQRKLDATVAIPSFRKSSSTSVVTGSSKATVDTRRPLTKTGPKNEALSTRIHSSEESSSSDSDSDSDDGAGVEAFRDSKPKSPKKPRPVERRQIKTLEIPVKVTFAEDRLMRNRQAHYNAMRMRPDITDLHRVILSWDYTHLGPIPPGKPYSLLTVPSRFDNYEYYVRVFRPLLLMECWAQLQQSKEEKQESYECKVESRQYVDDWLDIDITISQSVKKDWYLAETDVILLRKPGIERCLMGKVKSYRALPIGIFAVVRCYVQGEMGDPGLQISTLWQISKVLSLSTLHREYGALVSLKYNDMCDFILRPSLPSASDVNLQDLEETMETYKVNQPQATAILKAMQTKGFSLIQGPPGTGKTSTICGLIARFLSQRPRAAVPIVVGRSTSSENNMSQVVAPTARILVCAPSNAAIDELGQRIKDGFVGSQKKSNSRPLNIVRIGAEQAISATVRDISLDYLVEQKLDNTPKSSNDLGDEIRSIRQELESVKQSRIVKLAELTNLTGGSSRKTSLENEVKVLNSRRQALITKLDAQKDKQKSDSRTLDTLRRNTRRDIITQADVICSTLSGAGHEILENLEFDMIIIDEAAQAIELSSLIPLKYACTRCVMVGDPQQLPPTVLSQEASRFGYNQSLFVRLQQSNRDAINLLSIQYRMHPDISSLPSQIFYDKKLLDGPNMAEKTKQPWHTHPMFGTYKFLNVLWGIEESSGHSIKNSAECNTAADLYNRLRRDFSSLDFTLRIGVVSMYKAQINALRRMFVDRFGNDVLSKVDFNTVDGFQGQEKDIIILSCVRAGPGLQTVGFLSDIRRMNVALTRAKSSLFVLGHTPTLERSDPTWKKIIEDARTRSALVTIDQHYFARSSISEESKDAPSKKKTRPVAKPAQTPMPPPGLVTPQQLKASVEASQTHRTSGQISSTSPSLSIANNTVSSEVHLVPSHGIKRPLDIDAPPPARSKLQRLSGTSLIDSAPPDASMQGAADPTISSSSSTTRLLPQGTKRPSGPDVSDSGPSKPSKPPLPRKKPKQQTMFIPKKRT